VNRFIVLSALVSVLCVACAGPRLVFLTDAPGLAALGGEEEAVRLLAPAAGRHGLSVRAAAPGPQESARSKLERELSRGRVAAALIGPLLSAEAAGLAAAHPSVRFILLGRADQGAPNVVRLGFDRREALQSAGRACGLSLRAEGKGRVGILVSSWRNPRSEQDLADFQAGLARADAPPALVKELAEPVTKAAVAGAVTELARAGAVIFFPRLGWENMSCLEALKGTGGSAVTEDWRASGAWQKQVFLSLEEDLADGVDRCLAAGPQEREVAGRVILQCGGARPVPGEMEDRIQCR
jgi:hypothetical protein